MLCSRAQWWIRKIVSLDHIFKPMDQQLGSLTIRFPPLHVYFFLSSMGSSGSHKQAQKQCRSEEQRCFCHCTAETLRDASEDSVSRHGLPCLFAHGRRGFFVCDSLSQQELCVRLGYWFVSANQHSLWSSVSLLVFSNTGYKVWSIYP